MNTVQYDEIGKEYTKKINPTKQYARLSTILEMTGSIKQKDILDLACGDGYYTRQLAELKPSKLYGIDISSVMIHKAKEQDKINPTGIKYFVGDALSLTLTETFDCIIAIYLLDYAKTKNELLQMCKTIFMHLKPNGIFATITLIPRTTKDVYYLGWRTIHPEGKKQFMDGDQILLESDPKDGPQITLHCCYWSEKTYTECLNKAGFSEVFWKRTYTISEEGKQAYPPEFWEEMQRNTSGVGIKAVKK